MLRVVGPRGAFRRDRPYFAEPSLRRNELVPDPANRHDALRIVWIALDLAAQVRDVHVCSPLVADVLALPEVLHDLSPRVHLLWLFGEEGEEPELRRRQPHVLVVDAHLVPDEIELQPADAPYRIARETVELAAPQDRPDPADQLGHRERLGDVIVCADLEPDDAVDLAVLCGQHEDGDDALAAQDAGDLDAV